MADYQTYSCSDLLILLDKMYANGKDSDKTNYAEYLLNMESAKSIDQLIKIYDKIFIKLLDYAIKAPNEIPNDWSDISKNNSYLILLNGFLNEQIERLFYLYTYSDKIALKSLVNLRYASNFEEIIKRISSHCSESVNAQLSDIYIMSKIVQFTSKSLNSNSSKDRKLYYKKNISILMNLGYIRSYRDIRIGNKIGLFVPDAHFFYSLLISIIGIISLILVATNDSINDFAKTYIYIPISIGIILWGALNVMMNYNGDFIEENKFNLKQEIIVLLISLLGGYLIFMLLYITVNISIFGIILLIGLPGALLSYLK